MLRRARLVAVVSLAVALGCSSSPKNQVCTPGATAACSCATGASGVETCTADGSGYGSCLCGTQQDAGATDAGGANDAGVTDAGGGTDAGTADSGTPTDAGAADAGGGCTADGGSGFATALLCAHDAVRASAQPPPTPPLAPDSWDTTVAGTAQNWASQCMYQHNPNLGTLGYGENIAASSGVETPDQIVALWAGEAQYYDYATNSCAAGQTCLHYTQIVWRDSTGLGCASVTCNTNSPFGSEPWYFWVCDYSPAGNIIGQSPY